MNSILQGKRLLPTSETIYKDYSILLNEIGLCIFEDIDRIKTKSMETYEAFYKNYYEEMLHTRFELEKQIKEIQPARPFECMCIIYNNIAEDLQEYIINKFPKIISDEDFYRIINNRQQAYYFFIDSIKSIWKLKEEEL